MLAAHVATHAGIPPVLCTLLLIALVVTFVVALLEVLGVATFVPRRWAALVAALILLVLYVVLC